MPYAKAVGETVRGKPLPVPLNQTACGLPAALSFTESVAVCGPAACGENTTVMRQPLLGWSTVPEQPSLLILKSVVFAPVILAAILVSGAVPTLVKVTVAGVALGIGWLPKFTVVGARLTNGVVPVHVRGTDCNTGELL